MKMLNMIKRLIPVLILTGGILIISYLLFVRPAILKLGVKDKELNMNLTGDELVISPDMEYMQAITIYAPRELIWKYLIQVGYKRGGWYNLDFINRMTAKDYFYENNKSADRIIPELQNLKVNDKIYLNPNLNLDVSVLKENKVMLLTVNEEDKYLVSWVYSLKEISQDKSRLYVRWKSNLGSNILLKMINTFFIEPGSAIQQSFMLRGIKKRTESFTGAKRKGINNVKYPGN